jgi:hypothetical protein
MRGDGRRHQAHEAVKLAMKRFVLSCSDPAGRDFPKESILTKPPTSVETSRALVTYMLWERDYTKRTQ